jgi:U3 small nucleolar RNA-associated protein 13
MSALQVWDLAAALQAADSADASSPAQMLVTAAVAAHDKDINAVAVSPNDALVVTASQDRTAKVR